MADRTWLSTTCLPCVALALALALACGSSSSGTGTIPPAPAPAPAPGVTVSGTVAASSGSAVAQLTGKGVQGARLRQVLGAVATSAPGTTPLGAGSTVNLIQINAAGTQVGAVIATTVTNADGTYSLTAPAGFTPGPSYVVVAEAPGGTIQGFVTSTTANADPYTQTTVTLVTGALAQAGASIDSIGASAIAAVQETVLSNSGSITLTGTTTTPQMAAALAASVQNDVEDANIVTSLTAPNGITGTVQDAGGNPLVGIQILVRTFGNQVTMATTRTDATGAYTVQVPAGNYIVGAINDTATSMAASAWWSSSGMQTSQFQASNIPLAATPVSCDFTLQPGGRLTGLVATSDTGLPLSGITVSLNDFSSGQTLLFLKTQPDGTVNFNVAAGSYYVSMRNNTLQPYATGCIDGTLGGGKNLNMASNIVVVAGQSQSGQMTLVPGYQLQGLISDPVTGPVAGMVVRFQDYDAGGVGAETARSGVDGSYCLWVQPGDYNVWTRGQQANDLNCTARGGGGADHRRLAGPERQPGGPGVHLRLQCPRGQRARLRGLQFRWHRHRLHQRQHRQRRAGVPDRRRHAGGDLGVPGERRQCHRGAGGSQQRHRCGRSGRWRQHGPGHRHPAGRGLACGHRVLLGHRPGAAQPGDLRPDRRHLGPRSADAGPQPFRWLLRHCPAGRCHHQHGHRLPFRPCLRHHQRRKPGPWRLRSGRQPGHGGSWHGAYPELVLLSLAARVMK